MLRTRCTSTPRQKPSFWASAVPRDAHSLIGALIATWIAALVAATRDRFPYSRADGIYSSHWFHGVSQPEGLIESSRWSERSADHRKHEIEFPRRKGGRRPWHPFRVRANVAFVPVVSATLRPPATFCQPFRLKSPNHRYRPIDHYQRLTRAAINPFGLPLLQTIREGIQRASRADK